MKAIILSALSIGLLVSLNQVSAGRSPVLAFSSSHAGSDLLPVLGPSSSLSAFTSQLFSSSDARPAEVCTLDALVVVAADALDRSTFASLRHSSPSLRQRALGAPAQLTFDVVDGASVKFEQQLKEQLESACGGHAGLVELGLEDHIRGGELGQRAVVSVRVQDLNTQEESLLRTLSEIDEAYPRSLVIIAPTSDRHLFKRQFSTLDDFVASQKDDKNGSWTEPEGSIFARYQLFSTAQILILLIVFGILVPATFIVIDQLATVQVPDQIGVRKDPITGDKKSQ